MTSNHVEMTWKWPQNNIIQNRWSSVWAIFIETSTIRPLQNFVPSALPALPISWRIYEERVLEREIKQKSVVGILILLTLMNGDVATVNNDELSDIQYIKCTYYWIEYIRSKRINVYGHACTWLRDRKSTWDDTITLQHENTTTKPIITNIDKVTQQSENVGIFIKRTVPRALFVYWFSFKFGELNVSRTGSLKWRKSSIRFVFVCSLERPSSD